MNRESQLLALRPSLTTLSQEAQPKSVEIFQNEVLRPILKFQNNLTLALLKSQPHFSPEVSDRAKLVAHIKTICNQPRFKNQLIGMIIGLMSVQEYTSYAGSLKEYNKRILSMQAERFMDQLG